MTVTLPQNLSGYNEYLDWKPTREELLKRYDEIIAEGKYKPLGDAGRDYWISCVQRKATYWPWIEKKKCG